MKYEILEHPTDLKIRVFGKTKEEVFLNTLLAMFENQRVEVKEKEKVKRKIEVEAIDLPSLLVDFLNEVLYLNQINKEAYFDVKFEVFVDNKLKGELAGYKVESFGEDIKAATYHDLDIRQKEEFEATILFDI